MLSRLKGIVSSVSTLVSHYLTNSFRFLGVHILCTLINPPPQAGNLFVGGKDNYWVVTRRFRNNSARRLAILLFSSIFNVSS